MSLCEEILIYDNTKKYELIVKITNEILALKKMSLGLII